MKAQGAWNRSTRRIVTFTVTRASAVVTGRKAQVGEESRNHRRLNDGGNDLQGAAALRAVFEIDIEDALEQAHPAHARGRRLRMGMIG